MFLALYRNADRRWQQREGRETPVSEVQVEQLLLDDRQISSQVVSQRRDFLPRNVVHLLEIL